MWSDALRRRKGNHLNPGVGLLTHRDTNRAAENPASPAMQPETMLAMRSAKIADSTVDVSGGQIELRSDVHVRFGILSSGPTAR